MKRKALKPVKADAGKLSQVEMALVRNFRMLSDQIQYAIFHTVAESAQDRVARMGRPKLTMIEGGRTCER